MPVEEAGITFVDGYGDLLETRADGNHRLSVPEGGEARYGLRLDTRPAKRVVLSFHLHAGDADLDVPRNYSSDRSIAPDEWVARTVWVRVKAAQDADAANGERVFAHNTASNDPNYHHLVLPDVVVVEADDEEPTCTRNPGDIWCGVVTVGSQLNCLAGTPSMDSIHVLANSPTTRATGASPTERTLTQLRMSCAREESETVSLTSV